MLIISLSLYYAYLFNDFAEIVVPTTPPPANMSDDARAFRGRVVTTIVVTVTTITLLLIAFFALDVLLMIFFAVLWAIALRGIAGFLHHRLKMPVGMSVLSALVLVLVVLVLTGALLGQQIAGQFDQLSEKLPQSIERIRTDLEQYRWARSMLAEVPTPEEFNNMILGGNTGVLFARASSVFSSTLGSLANTLIVFVLGIFFALEAEFYVANLLRLIPLSRRLRASEIFAAIGEILRRWLVARFLSMAVVGILTTIGLFLLNVPLALTLGLIAGLLSFIPTFGPVISAVPASLIGLLDSPAQALYILILFVLVQQIESYLITPFIERQTVSLPPVLTIIAQLFLGVFTGFLGLVLAAPIAATTSVLVRMIYVEDVLGDRAAPPIPRRIPRRRRTR